MGASKDSGAESHRLRGTDPYPRKVQGCGKKGSSHRQLPQRTSGIMVSSKHHCIPQTTPKPRRARSSHTKPVRRSPRGKVTTTGISTTEIEAEDICSGLWSPIQYAETDRRLVRRIRQAGLQFEGLKPQLKTRSTFQPWPLRTITHDYPIDGGSSTTHFRSGSTMRNSGFKGKCNKCGKFGHKAVSCRTLKDRTLATRLMAVTPNLRQTETAACRATVKANKGMSHISPRLVFICHSPALRSL